MSESDAPEIRQRRRRNLAIGLGISSFVLLVFLVTIFRIGGNIASVAP